MKKEKVKQNWKLLLQEHQMEKARNLIPTDIPEETRY